VSTRLNADERRALVVAAATRAFARGGYAGTSTDAVAKESGVSQPYVVRIFGTKLQLFLEVLGNACETIRTTFESVIHDGFDPTSEDDWARISMAYTELARDRDLLMVLMHGFAAGDDDAIAARAREGMGSIYATIMTTGCDEERAVEFFAQGMLLNVMLSMRAPEHLDEDTQLGALTRCAFGDSLELLTP
jgi:AcrR family transcriptional regulator